MIIDIEYRMFLEKIETEKTLYMKTIKLALFGILLTSVFIGITGCETESSDQIAIKISPNTARVRVGESQEFVATGFSDYTWSLSKPEMGAISTTKGDRTVYTAFTSNTTDVQVLTCEVVIAAGTTNGTPASAEALISHY